MERQDLRTYVRVREFDLREAFEGASVGHQKRDPATASRARRPGDRRWSVASLLGGLLPARRVQRAAAGACCTLCVPDPGSASGG